MEISRIILDVKSEFVSRINKASQKDHRSRNSFVTKAVMDRVEVIEKKYPKHIDVDYPRDEK